MPNEKFLNIYKNVSSSKIISLMYCNMFKTVTERKRKSYDFGTH